jgi:xylulokinase
MTYVLAYDIGTTGVKTCVFGVDSGIRLLAGANEGYGLYLSDDGGAEQDADEWWAAMGKTTRAALRKAGIAPEDIAGVSFCSQMQGMVLVDAAGVPVHRPMSYMDQRSREELRRGMANGLQIAGANVVKLARSLAITGAVSSSVKDPVWKYKWVERHEPENFARACKWLDVKEYLLARCTGRFVMTEDSAYATLLCDTRHGRTAWSPEMCRMLGVRPEHLAGIIRSTDVAGPLTEKAAAELGLAPGTPVFGGGGDASLIGVGAGCVRPGDTHLYCGTSGWVSTVLDHQALDTGAMIAAIVGAQSGLYNYFAEMETAGKCLEWVKDHLALDEIGVYLQKTDVAEGLEAQYTSLYDYLTETIGRAAPGAGGVVFTPWLHGNRCPFEDPDSAGVFFGIRLETGKTELLRAVVEGVCFHLRWMLERQDRKIKTSDPVRFVGGGALSAVTCQILADVTGRTVETVASPQNVGSVGAAAVAAVGLGLIPSLADVRDFVPVTETYRPNAENRAVYDRNFAVFTNLYRANRENFRILAQKQPEMARAGARASG